MNFKLERQCKILGGQESSPKVWREIEGGGGGGVASLRFAFLPIQAAAAWCPVGGKCENKSLCRE